MKVIVCLDDQNGMMFNHRRLSRDRYIYEDAINQFGKENIVVKPQTAMLFGAEDMICRDDLPCTSLEQYQWIEDDDLASFQDDIIEVVAYYWHRLYPSDLKLALDFHDGSWKIVDQKDFPGYSHDVITRIIYQKKHSEVLAA